MTAMATAQASGLPPKGGAVHAGGEGAGGGFGAEHGTHGDAAGERFGEGGDVGEDGFSSVLEVLIGTPFAGAAHAGLDLVEEQKGAGGVAEFAGGAEEVFGDEVDAAFALEYLEGNGADVFGEGGAEGIGVVEGDELDIAA